MKLFKRKHVEEPWVPSGLMARVLIHCNDEVLHAPGVCGYCDDYPDRQAARQASGGGFTPPEANGWMGNVAQPKGRS